MTTDALPSPGPASTWLTPFLLGGIGIGGALAWWFIQHNKDKKMTKLEKACVAFVIAIGERVEELEKRNAELTKDLNERPTKSQLKQAEDHAGEMIKKLSEAEERAKRAESALALLKATAAMQPKPKARRR